MQPRRVRDLPLNPPRIDPARHAPRVTTHGPEDAAAAQRLLDLLDVPRGVASIWTQGGDGEHVDFVLAFESDWKGMLPDIPSEFEGRRVTACRIRPITIRHGD